MVVGTLEISLQIPGSRSLKDKRLALRSLMDRMRRRLNVAVSETGAHDVWGRAELGIVTVSNDSAVAHSVLMHAQSMAERDPRLVLVDVHVDVS